MMCLFVKYSALSKVGGVQTNNSVYSYAQKLTHEKNAVAGAIALV